MRTRRRHRAGAALALTLGPVLALAGCGSSGTAGGTGTTGTTTTATTAAPATSATTGATTSASSGTATTAAGNFQGRLLTVADLPAGWEAGPPVNDQDFDDSTQVPCDGVAVNPTIAQRIRPVAGIQFEPSDRNAYRQMIELVTAGEPARLAADLDAYIGAVGSCPAPGTAGAATTVETFSLPALGDQRAAFRLRASPAPGTVWYVRQAIVRVGPNAVRVALTEILSPPEQAPTITDDAFVGIVRAAIARLGA